MLGEVYRSGCSLRVFTLTPLLAYSFSVLDVCFGRRGLSVSCSCHCICPLLPCLPTMLTELKSRVTSSMSCFWLCCHHYRKVAITHSRFSQRQFGVLSPFVGSQYGFLTSTILFRNSAKVAKLNQKTENSIPLQ